MKCSCLALSIFALAAAALAGDASTALEAVKLLPPGKAAKIAWIEGREGNPEPDRWYLIVEDEFDENGLHEYVVAGSEIVASRSISQFVSSLKPEDIVGAGSIKVDSSSAGRIAAEYAAANGMKFSKLNFRLKREGEQPVEEPVWKVTCLDESGSVVGEVALNATNGTVLSHDGFASAPAPAPRSASVRKKRRVVVAEPLPIAAPPDNEGAPNLEPRNSDNQRANRGFFQRVGGSLSHIFTGQ